MAGSYKHIVNEDNEFQGVEHLDNLGDAYEALEECFEIIQHLTGGDRRKIHKAWLEGYAKKHYPESNAPLFTYESFWSE